jgi:lysophospholipase L1-like esterase
MSFFKKIFFAFISLLLFAAIIEGAAYAIWLRLESHALAERYKRGEEQLRNDGINFLKQADRLYGYTLKPGSDINQQGFAQRDTVPLPRQPGFLRIIAMGESTTHGHNVNVGNYPIYLRSIVKQETKKYSGVEMINAGVAGWVSDQIALRAEHQTAAYRPDLVVLYVGFNDFQCYNPLGPASKESYFEFAYGKNAFLIGSRFKSIVLLNAVYSAVVRELNKKREIHPETNATPSPALVSKEEIYRFYFNSLDRIVAAYRKANPQVQIAISTLVGRWPYGSPEEFKGNGSTWWMQKENLTPEQAADFMNQFNDLIRDYAGKNGLVLIDAAYAFENLDRARLQWDFAHMHSEGYELLAETMYATLRAEKVIDGEKRPRLEELKAKYQKPGA